MHSGSGVTPSAGIDEIDTVGVLGSAVDHVVRMDVPELPDAVLAADVVRMRTEMDRLASKYAELVLTANRRGIGREDGHHSTGAWIRWQTGQTLGEVRRVEQAGRVAELLPATGRAWRDGQISSRAVALLAQARVPGHDEHLAACEDEFLQVARNGDHRGLQLLTRHFAACARAEGNASEEPDGIGLALVGDRTVVTGELHGDSAETVAHAIGVFTRPPSETDSALPSQRRAEALVRICEIALEHGTDAVGRKPAVAYVIRRAEPSEGRFAGVLDPATRARILCDASISRVVVDADDLPLNVGRASPTWPVAIRKAIVVRDRHCRWPGCEIPAPWTDVHHFQHWEDGGGTSVENGVLLCRRHHTFLHTHPTWRYTFAEQRFRAHRPDGTRLCPDRWITAA